GRNCREREAISFDEEIGSNGARPSRTDSPPIGRLFAPQHLRLAWQSKTGCSMVPSSLTRRLTRPCPEGRKSMKRRDFIKVTGLGAAAAATIAAPAIAQSLPEIKWRMPTSWPKSLDTLYGGAEMMAKMVAEATDNKFQIQTFAGGEIVPGLQVLDAVQ